MKFFNLDSPIMQFLSKVADLMLLNILTLLLCLPIITAGDAITALYYMTLKLAKGEEGYVLKGYFKSFKENFVQATVIWIIAMLIIGLLAGDYFVLTVLEFGNQKWMWAAISMVAILFLFELTYVFPVLSRFVNTIRGTIKNAFLMSIMNLPWTIVMIVVSLVPIALLLLSFQMIPFLFMFGFSVPAYLNSNLLAKKVFVKYEPKEEEESEELETLSFIREEEEEKVRRLNAGLDPETGEPRTEEEGEDQREPEV